MKRVCNTYKMLSFHNCESDTEEQLGNRENKQNYLVEKLHEQCESSSSKKIKHENLQETILPTLPEEASNVHGCKHTFHESAWKTKSGSGSHEGIHTKMLSVSGISQFSIKTPSNDKVINEDSKGKAQYTDSVIVMQSLKHDREHSEMQPPELSERCSSPHHAESSLKESAEHWIVMQNGINLRQWLGNPSRTVDKIECLHIFKQILELVDDAHSQGRIFRRIRPSCFALSPLNHVIFLESPANQLNPSLHLNKKRSRHFEPATGALHISGSYNRPRLSDHFSTGGALTFTRSSLVSSFGLSSNDQNSRISHQNHFSDSRGNVTKEKNLYLSNAQCSTLRFCKDNGQFVDQLGENEENYTATLYDNIYNPTQDLLMAEDNWYTSPEEHNGTPASPGTQSSPASDVYSLGVLLFELFCTVPSFEEQKAIMSNLRHRILPPRFLSEHPKEAGFCLWLLHPAPFSRPRAREILQSELFNEVQNALTERDRAVNLDIEEAETELLMDFLLHLQKNKREKAIKLSHDFACLISDIEEVKRRQSNLTLDATVSMTQDESAPNEIEVSKFWMGKGSDCIDGRRRYVLPQETSTDNNFIVTHSEKKQLNLEDTRARSDVLASKGARLMKNFKHLEQVYFSVREKIESPGPHPKTFEGLQKSSDADSSLQTEACGLRVQKPDSEDPLGCFFDSICKYARYSHFEVRATLRHGDLLNSANVICSVSFDRDQEFFAVAGVSKKIKVFGCDAILNENVDIHYPAVEITSAAKLSSVCWNNYIKSYIASTDYDGFVQLWDASIGQKLVQYNEHRKRAWSVDFSLLDPTKLASGSDDCTVKLWSIKQENSIDTLKTVANVCCVQFPPDSAHKITFGSADYKIYCYDLRNTRTPWCTLEGHQKAVSYIKFLDSNTIISASTDSTLKMWDLTKAMSTEEPRNACTLTFSGHTNEKNFVGLTVADGYIACGSETNSVFAYYKSLPMPMASHKFGCIDPISGLETDDDNGQFVSSVCWRGTSKLLVAANSTGNIKLLEMV